MPPAELATKVKTFFHKYAINRHKACVITPALLCEQYCPDDNRWNIIRYTWCTTHVCVCLCVCCLYFGSVWIVMCVCLIFLLFDAYVAVSCYVKVEVVLLKLRKSFNSTRLHLNLSEICVEVFIILVIPGLICDPFSTTPSGKLSSRT